MIEYIGKATTTWFLGFFPFFEIYAAIPAGIIMGLDPVSAAGWGAFGNFSAVPLILVFHRQLMAMRGIGPWLTRRSTGKSADFLNRHGPWVIVFVTPWIGIWVVAAIAKVGGMDQRKLLLFSLISVVVYAIIIAGSITLGVDFFGTEETDPVGQ